MVGETPTLTPPCGITHGRGRKSAGGREVRWPWVEEGRDTQNGVCTLVFSCCRAGGTPAADALCTMGTWQRYLARK